MFEGAARWKSGTAAAHTFQALIRCGESGPWVTLARLCAAVFLLAEPAIAKDWSAAPDHAWFENLRNGDGFWCCDPSDGEPYFGNYTLNSDGSADLDNPRIHVPKSMVVKANPTGHPILWAFFEDGKPKARCFSPGTMG